MANSWLHLRMLELVYLECCLGFLFSYALILIPVMSSM